MPLTSDDRLRFGVCHAPELWPRARWERDFELMRAMGLECMRWGEGAWTLIEPAEDRFDFALADEVISAAAANGLGIILATPTDAPPAWLEERYPAAIALREDGTPWHRHSRRMYDYTDPDYRRRCRRIVDELARRYAGDERIWAWQIDSEMWCHCDSLWGERVRRSFQDWLRRRYERIDELNDAWGLRFWSNQLDGFHQADLPGPTPANRNHHQHADYLAFLSDLAIGFLHEQAQIIRAADTRAAVLHNLPFDPVDRPALLAGLDIYGHDHYPAFLADPADRPAGGLWYGRFRAYARRLWTVEQESSQVGQTSFRLPASPPGQLAAAALQSIGHGADLLAWSPWRAYPAAQESNWGGLLPTWGDPGRHYQEARDLVTALAPRAAQIAATRPEVTVARLLSFRQWQAHIVEPWIRDSLGNPECGWRALRELGLNEDQLRPVDLVERSGYTVALLPHAVALTADDAFALARWVEAGGMLVVGPLAGHRDEDLHGPVIEPPGAIAPLTGTVNGESTTWPRDLTILGRPSGQTVEVGRYGEVVEPRQPGVEVLATYLTDWLAGRPAVTWRPLGAGRVIHCGVPLCDAVLRWLWEDAGLPPGDLALITHESPAEVLTRSGGGHRFHFAINHGPAPAVFHIRRPLADLATGEAVTNSFTLLPYGWRVLCEYPGSNGTTVPATA